MGKQPQSLAEALAPRNETMIETVLSVILIVGFAAIGLIFAMAVMDD